jgi:hypothetical protein
MMRFDPKLQISEAVAYALEYGGVGPVLPSVTFTSEYHVPLTCEVRDGEAYVRAAMGDEVEDALTTGLVTDEDALPWPGDEPTALEHQISWGELPDGPTVLETAALLWAGEVLVQDGSGLAGPFFVHQLAAEAWAFSTAMSQPDGTVFECQIVPYACAWSQAPGLLRGGNDEARRLGKFDVSPLRTCGTPSTVLLPGHMSVADNDDAY